MSYANLLLKKMEDGTNEQFEDYAKRVRGSTPNGHAFLYALAIANDSLGNAFRESYQNQIMLIGGYAVLGHIIKTLGPEAATQWRGSHDLDIVCQSNQAVRNLILEYNSLDMRSTSLPDKKTTKFKDIDIGDVCEADLYYPSDKNNPEKIRIANSTITRDDFKKADVVDVLGVPYRIMKRDKLLKMKLGIMTADNLPREKDIIDIYNLLGISEREGVKPNKFSWQHLGENERRTLYDIINYTMDNPDLGIESGFVLVKPSREFLKHIERARVN